MNSKQVRSVLCGLSPEEQDILQDEYGISARVSDVGLGVTENMNDELGKEELRKGLQEREEIASFQSRLFQLVGRNWADYTSEFGRKVGHPKPCSQKNKEVAKRRKNNRNKKTHRKK